MSRRPEHAAALAAALAGAGALAGAFGCERQVVREGAAEDAAPTVVATIRPTPTPTTGTTAVAAPSATPHDDAGDAGTFDPAPYLAATPRAAKSIGHTSVVFRVDLGPGVRAAWKPRSRRGGDRYRGEVAARRLAEALGIGGQVPPALLRSYAEADFARLLGAGRDAEFFAKEALATNGSVPGALIPWIDDLEFLPLEQEPLWTRCRVWLTKGQAFTNEDPSILRGLKNAEEPERRAIARQASILIAFDYLTANFDRWSGGNVGWLPKKHQLLFVDNDGAFLKTPPKDALARNERLAFAIDRHSRSFLASLRALEDAKLAQAFGVDEAGKPLLAADVVAGVIARKKALLATITKKVAQNGEDETYYFR